MSGRLERALKRLALEGGAMVAVPQGFALFPAGDRRRRPLARLTAEEVRSLARDGALSAQDGGYVLTEAGRARAGRSAAAETLGDDLAFAAQHASLQRSGEAGLRTQDPTLSRLARLGVLSAIERAAAERFRNDVCAGASGAIRGVDWTAPPRSGAARGAPDAAAGAAFDARARVRGALTALAEPLRRVLTRALVEDQGLEAIERAEGWPPRSGKVALKLALAQLATRYGLA